MNVCIEFGRPGETFGRGIPVGGSLASATPKDDRLADLLIPGEGADIEIDDVSGVPFAVAGGGPRPIVGFGRCDREGGLVVDEVKPKAGD